MAYHSGFNEASDRFRVCCGCPLVPLNTQGTAGATNNSDGDSGASSPMDPVDEAIELFRPNSLFKSFDIRGPGDKLLVYLIMFISSCLRRIADRKPTPNREEARSLLFSQAHDRFPLPGQAGFPLGALMSAPANKEEEETIRSYLRQCREEAGRRLVDRIYTASSSSSGSSTGGAGSGGGGNSGDASAAAVPNKHWLAFANRRFMDRTI
ncbi:hypothetical protein Agub_g10604 [Astrephomene gubernaculifera]|uniref:Actin-related protein 2/3 complex subunit 3 n=1 Tax=Astrephomene gubernaculifera TaxID=47775 RepID=A0AAD3HQ88_9CHLO|nr:hypothetical protein Agub_g10604 [Astrephomene gubernaculifera]